MRQVGYGIGGLEAVEHENEKCLVLDLMAMESASKTGT
jgi:hypothetical protein